MLWICVEIDGHVDSCFGDSFYICKCCFWVNHASKTIDDICKNCFHPSDIALQINTYDNSLYNKWFSFECFYGRSDQKFVGDNKLSSGKKFNNTVSCRQTFYNSKYIQTSQYLYCLAGSYFGICNNHNSRNHIGKERLHRETNTK